MQLAHFDINPSLDKAVVSTLNNAKSKFDFCILGLLVAFPSTGVIQKYTGLVGVVFYVLAVLGFIFFSRYILQRFAPWMRLHFRVISIFAIAGLAVGFMVLHPIEDGRGPGKSSDRDEGLEIAVTRMARGETPYYPSNKIAGPLSVMPGSMLLAAPFVVIGTSGWQNVFWLAALLFAASSFFKDSAAGIWLLVVPLTVSVAAQYEFISGGDLIANGIFVALFFLLAMNSWKISEAASWQRWLACVLVGISLASRANFLLLMPLFVAAIWRLGGLKNAVVAGVIAGLTAISITLPFYLHDPAAFAPLGTSSKLKYWDQVLPWASKSIIAMTILASLLGSLWLLASKNQTTTRNFFRCCTIVTLTPMIAAILISSWVNEHADFGIMKDRFGLMYVCFAILGWGNGLRESRLESDGDA